MAVVLPLTPTPIIDDERNGDVTDSLAAEPPLDGALVIVIAPAAAATTAAKLAAENTPCVWVGDVVTPVDITGTIMLPPMAASE